MEENKFDLNTFIGFMLIGAILLWMLYQNQPTEQELMGETAQVEQTQTEVASEQETERSSTSFDQEQNINEIDSVAVADRLRNELGDFAYAATRPSWVAGWTGRSLT